MRAHPHGAARARFVPVDERLGCCAYRASAITGSTLSEWRWSARRRRGAGQGDTRAPAGSSDWTASRAKR
ncbi:hypothetical protein APY03_3709 [Variovorax sp. WDL1]|nr:hypothetical protein APY03_3709 [Variovorax sp. WDL1]